MLNTLPGIKQYCKFTTSQSVLDLIVNDSKSNVLKCFNTKKQVWHVN